MSDEAILVLVAVLATGAVSLAVQWFSSWLRDKSDVKRDKRQRIIEYNLRMLEPAQKVLARAAARSKDEELMKILRKAGKEVPEIEEDIGWLNDLDSQLKGKKTSEMWRDDLPIVTSVLDGELRNLLLNLLVGQIGRTVAGIPKAGTPQYDELLRAAHERIRKLVTEVD